MLQCQGVLQSNGALSGQERCRKALLLCQEVLQPTVMLSEQKLSVNMQSGTIVLGSSMTGKVASMLLTMDSADGQQFTEVTNSHEYSAVENANSRERSAVENTNSREHSAVENTNSRGHFVVENSRVNSAVETGASVALAVSPVPAVDAAITSTVAPSMVLASAVVLPQAPHEPSIEEAETDDQSSTSSSSSLGAGTFGRGEGNDDLDDPYLNDPAENEMSMGVVNLVLEAAIAASLEERERVLEARAVRMVERVEARMDAR